jgi:UDP-glucuronate 4-epimerase
MGKILVTGAAGFIGYHLCKRLIDRGDEVIGIDNLNDYYDVNLKKARLQRLDGRTNFTFMKTDISNKNDIKQLFKTMSCRVVVHLAAQPGVRYSLINPFAYIESNVVSFLNILEGCRHSDIKHLVYASSSSIYGTNLKMPFSVGHNVDHPVSLYAATKKSNELMAHVYSSLYNIPTTGLRFFTVYGPWGRPDMAYFSFTKAIMEGKPIDVFNNGNMKRDFTYIDDIIEGIIRVMDKVPQPNPAWDRENPDPGTSYAPYRLYNIGNNEPVDLMRFIAILEDCLGKKVQKNMLPMQSGDVPVTYADVDDLMRDVGFKPSTPLSEGIKKFVVWYKSYYS